MQEAVVTKMGGIVRNLWASAELVAAERTTSCTLPAPMIGIMLAYCCIFHVLHVIFS